MYEKLIITPEFEHYNKLSDTLEVCPVLIEMKLWTKEWIRERITYKKENRVEFITSINSFVSESVSKIFSLDADVSDETTLLYNTIESTVLKEINKELQLNAFIPLKEFECDTCHTKISINEQPLIEYYEDVKYHEDDTKGFMFVIGEIRIVHDNDACSFDAASKSSVMIIPIDNKGLDRDLISELVALKEQYSTLEDVNKIDEIIKRLSIPYYEEARQYKDEIENSTLDWPFQKYNRSVLREIVLNKRVTL